MPQRKVWSAEEDKILKLLREERGEKKWATIARLMQTEFGIIGRTGKQCRERQLLEDADSSIVSTEWTPEQEQLLYQMHEDIGNKWSIISQKLPGRSDNCVKNHFYSKLRKSLRRLNRLINQCFSEEKMIKESVLSRIIKTTDSKFKASSKIDQELADFCNTIKNRLFSFGLGEEDSPQQLEVARKLIGDIQHFEKDFKKGYKGLKVVYEADYTPFLKPPPPIGLKKRSSLQSWSSDKSDDSALSSSSFFSSSDLSDVDGDGEEFQNRTKSTGSATLSHRNSNDSTLKGGQNNLKSNSCQTNFLSILSKPKNESRQDRKSQMKEQKDQFCGQLKIETFAQEYRGIIEDQDNCYPQLGAQIHYNNMIYDDTPVIARILGPNDSESPFNFFGKGGENEEELEFKLDRMEL